MELKKNPKADLEKRKGLYFEIGLVVILAVCLCAFSIKSYDKDESTGASQAQAEEMEEMDEIENTDVEETPPPPPPPPAEEPELNMDQIEVVEDTKEIKTEIEIKDFMVFTGPQASGKSTIAKSIFFFNNLNNILFSMYQKEMAAKSLFRKSGLETAFSKEVQRAFLQSFGIEADSKEELNLILEDYCS